MADSTWLRLSSLAPLLTVLSGAALAVSCGDDVAPPQDDDGDTDIGDGGPGFMCTPGEELGCMCTDGTAGTQLCLDSGFETGECICDDGGSTGDDDDDDDDDDDATGDESGDTGVVMGCGNGDVEEGEQCDDANRVDDDACSNDCFEACGLKYEVRVEDRYTASFVLDMAEGPDGSSIVVGGITTPDDDDQAWVARYSADGEEEWAQLYGDDEGQWVQAVAVDDEGRIALAGVYDMVGNDDLWLVLLEANGDVAWMHQIDGPEAGDDQATGVAFAPNGDLLFSGSMRVGEGDTDLWVARYDIDGEEQWSSTFSGKGNGMFSTDRGGEIAVDQDGNAYALTSVYVAFEERDVHLVKFLPGGDIDWDIAPLTGGDPHEHAPAGVAITPDGDVLFGIDNDGVSINFRYWIYQYDSEGTEQWLVEGDDLEIGDRSTLGGLDVADDGRISLGIYRNPSTGDSRAIGASLDADGNLLCFAETFPTAGGDIGVTVGSTTASGDILFGGVAFTGNGEQTRYVIRARGGALSR